MASVLDIYSVLYTPVSVLSGRGTRGLACYAASHVSPPDEVERGVSAPTTRNFGRLKVHRANHLVKESYGRRQKGNGLESKEQKPESSQFHSAVELDDESYGENSIQDVSTKFSVSSSKQWGGVKRVNPLKSIPEAIKKKEQKLNAIGDFFSRKSFKELGCSDSIVECISKLHYARPSHIQAMAFAPVLNGKSCVVADQSGSGKTFAYLLPIVQRLRQEELGGPSQTESNNPRVIILVPTAELASQILSSCRSLSKSGVPFRSMVATGGYHKKTQLESLRQGIDVLISTPGRLTDMVNGGFMKFNNLSSVILDEVDILCNDEEFERALQSLINAAPITTQYLFITATLPLDIYNKLVEVFPDCELIMGPGMHRTSPGLEEILVDCSGGEEAQKTPVTAFINKKNALLRLAEATPVKKSIVFCNKIETCRKVENALKRFDRKETSVKVLPFHAALDQGSRVANLEVFCSFSSETIPAFLICTDRASRGIDFEGVDRVVLFDFPRDPSEYVRRVGRTARGAGGKGEAYIFAVGKQVSLARRIIERNLKGHPLHDVPSTYAV